MRNLFVLRGVAGCGKSTWIEENGLKPWTISSDDVRLLFDLPVHSLDGKLEISQKQNAKVWKFIYEILEKRMSYGELIFIDATHTKPSSLSIYKKLCNKYKYKLTIIDFTDVPLEEIKKFNSIRNSYKRVSEEVIDRMYKSCKLKLDKDIDVVKPKEFDLGKYSGWMINVLSSYKKIVVVGDIHSCYQPLGDYFRENPFNEKNYYMFLGDYFDRGIQAKETMEFLLSIYDKPNVCLLRGNHEIWIDNYVNNGDNANITDAFRKTLVDLGELKSELYKVRDKLQDAKILIFGNNGFIFTHGGIPDKPSIWYSAMECIKGVGEYSDNKKVEKAFLENRDVVFAGGTQWGLNDYYMFHGHRNLEKEPIQNDRVFNLEGQVEFGGCLRVVEIESNDDGIKFNNLEIKNDVYNQELKKKEIDSNSSIVNDLENSPLIHKKDLGDGTSSYNFTREAFWSSKWNSLTTTARGLFIDNETKEIVARSYPKFFAIDERPETEMRNLEKTLKFPVSLYRKENGYLGIVSVRNGEFYICSKSTNKGDYAGWFKDLFIKSVKDIDGLKNYLSSNNVSMIFEVIDIEHDPHIIEYFESKIILLDVVKNDFNDIFLPYNKLCEVADKFGLEYKHWFINVYNIKELNDTINGIDELHLNIEGFVGVDENGFMFKYKTTYYKFWKHIRNLRDKILNGKILSGLNMVESEIVSYMKKLHNEGLLVNMSIPEIRNGFNKIENNIKIYLHF